MYNHNHDMATSTLSYLNQHMNTNIANDIYDARMNDFCMAYLNNNNFNESLTTSSSSFLQRPKCSISPINPLALTTTDTTTCATSTATDDFHLPQLPPPTILLHPNDDDQLNATNNKLPNISHLILSTNHQDSGISLTNSSTSFILSNSTNHSSPSTSAHSSSTSYLNNSYSLLRSTQPYLLNTDTQLKQSQFQSTPNKSMSIQINNNPSKKQKCNFHSILDLAQSSTSSSSIQDSSINQQTNSNVTKTNLFKTNVNSNGSSISSSSSSFNENLKQLSLALQNKENTLPSMLNQNQSQTLKRKPRTQITKKQKEILDYAYAMKSYPDANEVEYLCHLLGFEENVIRIWFQNKRARHKNKNQL